ncbi:MAG: hypothetical protein ACJ788_00160, partial [Ktedonobacteraceae bacterium]
MGYVMHLPTSPGFPYPRYAPSPTEDHIAPILSSQSSQPALQANCENCEETHFEDSEVCEPPNILLTRDELREYMKTHSSLKERHPMAKVRTAFAGQITDF